jgi:hypothetical protein
MSDDERIAAGVEAVQAYLEAEFSGAPVEVLKPASWDRGRDTRTFKFQDGAATYRLRLVEEVLILDRALIARLLQEKRTGEVLRRHPGQTLLLTPSNLAIEPF